jgi:hypothetical protein
MHLILSLSFAALAAALPAQDAQTEQAAKARAAMAKAAATANTGFRLRWGPVGGGAAEPATGTATSIAVAPVAAGVRGTMRGSWTADRQHLAAEDDHGDEFVMAGRRTIARDATRPWRLRKARRADGSPAPFLPDVPALLALLADQDLVPVCRDVGTIDDRPVEIFGATLDVEQAAEAAWAGMLPSHWTLSPQRLNAGALRAAQDGGRKPPPAPTNTIDVAVWFEPATGIVRRLHLRSWSKQEIMRGNVVAVRINADGRPERVDPEEAAAEEAEAAKEAHGPPRFVDGMPVRPTRAASVHEFVIDLTGHGATDTPALDAAQKRLLGL